MMRLTILSLFFASFLQAQGNFLNATFKVDSSSFVSDYTFILHGKVNGIGFGGGDAVLGDRLIFMKDDTCGELAIDSILGASTFYLRVQVSSIDSIFDAAPFGVGVLSGKTVNNEFRSSTINASNDLINCIENRFKLEVDNIDVTLPDSLVRGRGTVDRFAYWNTDSTLSAAPEIVRSGGNLLLAAPLGLYSWTTGGEPSPVFGLLGINSSVGRPEYYNGSVYKRLIGGSVTQNYLMRADAAGDAVNASVVDDGTLISILNSRLFLPGQATTVGEPTGSSGGLYYNTTDNALRLFNGTIYQNIVAGPLGSGQVILPSHGLVLQSLTIAERNALPVTTGQFVYNNVNRTIQYYTTQWETPVKSDKADGLGGVSHIARYATGGRLTDGSNFIMSGNNPLTTGFFVSNRGVLAGIGVNRDNPALRFFIRSGDVVDNNTPFSTRDLYLELDNDAFNQNIAVKRAFSSASNPSVDSPRFCLVSSTYNSLSSRSRNRGFYFQAIKNAAAYDSVSLIISTLDSITFSTIRLLELRPNGFFRINNLTPTPTSIVGATSDNTMGKINIGSGLALSNGTLSAGNLVNGYIVTSSPDTIFAADVERAYRKLNLQSGGTGVTMLTDSTFTINEGRYEITFYPIMSCVSAVPISVSLKKNSSIVVGTVGFGTSFFLVQQGATTWHVDSDGTDVFKITGAPFDDTIIGVGTKITIKQL